MFGIFIHSEIRNEQAVDNFVGKFMIDNEMC